MTSLTAAWLATIGIVSVRDLSAEHRPPYPSELLASFAVFGLLGALAIPAPKAAGAIGWGLVLSILLSSQVDVLKPIGDFFSGANAVPSSSSSPPASSPRLPNASDPAGGGGGFTEGGGGGGGGGSAGGW